MIIMKFAIAYLFVLFFVPSVLCAVTVPTAVIDTPGFKTVDEIRAENVMDTKCASGVFANALAANASQVSETDAEIYVQEWIRSVFAQPNVLREVLVCPEIAGAAPDDIITFLPIEYVFPAGRRIIVNYETQPKILTQRMRLATKRSVADLDPSPQIGESNDGTIWTNVDPAWYAIMVVESGALDEFVGPDKNNTISMRYINDNIGNLYPRGNRCTSKSALAGNKDIINVAVHETIGIDKDSNDYYVAGDADLRWITYAEIGLDVVLTVATMGIGTAASWGAKSTRAVKTLNKLKDKIRALEQSESVVKYVKKLRELARLTDKIDATRKGAQVLKNLGKIDNVDDAHRIAKNLDYLDRFKDLDNLDDAKKQMDVLRRAARNTPGAAEIDDAAELLSKFDNVDDFRNVLKSKDSLRSVNSADDLKNLTKTSKSDEVAKLEKELADIEKADTAGDIKTYKDAMESFAEINKYRRQLKAIKIPQRGNVIARAWKSARVAFRGNDVLDKGARIARSGMKAGRTRDWLFHSTLKNAAALGKAEAQTGVLFGILKFAGDMYDYTETSTGEFTNGAEFKPLGLLSADDLDGQENVVNHGMWLMWMGDGINPADDDAAYLQAMDFASKFHQDLELVQQEHNSNACNVDIYVVRPVLRNPGTDNAELYYLIMNDVPWTTADK